MGRVGKLTCLAVTCVVALATFYVSKEAFTVLAPRSSPPTWGPTVYPDAEKLQSRGNPFASGAAAVFLGTIAVRAAQQNAKEGSTACAADISGGSLELFSPAKVNLFLRIIRRRPDGYHDLASLFHTVAFGDKLVLEAGFL